MGLFETFRSVSQGVIGGKDELQNFKTLTAGYTIEYPVTKKTFRVLAHLWKHVSTMSPFIDSPPFRKDLLPNEWVKIGLKVVSLRGRIACFSGQKICHGFGMRKYQRLCDTNRFPAFCPEQQERCDLRTKLRPK
jgi:hypothetical protein